MGCCINSTQSIAEVTLNRYSYCSFKDVSINSGTPFRIAKAPAVCLEEAFLDGFTERLTDRCSSKPEVRLTSPGSGKSTLHIA